MRPLLLDEGLPHQVAEALSVLGWPADCVGFGAAPKTKTSDEENCLWCKKRGAVLVTQDRGKKDKAILNALATHQVGGLFVRNDLRKGNRKLMIALLKAEVAIDAAKRVQARLLPSGKLERRD